MALRQKNSERRPTPNPSTSDDAAPRGDGIRIVSQSHDFWEVELFFPFVEVTEAQLSEKLKELKSLLSKQLDLARYDLRYQKLVNSKVTDAGVYTLLRLERVLIRKGKPSLTFQSERSPEGIPYDDMACYAELFYQDEFEKPLTEQRILIILKQHDIPLELIDKKAIQKAVGDLMSKSVPLVEVRLARGIFPEQGKDAEVEFYFHANPGKDNLNEYISSRKVEKGDMLCTRIPPKPGEKEGISVKGKRLPPGKGLDIRLVTGKNVRANIEGTSLTAEVKGLVVVKREEKSFMTPMGLKVVPSKITLRVDPLLVIEAGDKAVEITTNESVEIVGKLKMGSRIVSSGEVHIEGDILNDSIIQASHDIVVSGSVLNGDLSSDKNIIARGDVKGGRIAAGDNIVIEGKASNAVIIGKDVYVNEVESGEVYAGKQVAVNELGSEEAGISATICVGMREFLDKKVEGNQKFIDETMRNLNKLKGFFGDEIIRNVRGQNVQQMLLKFLSQIPRGAEANFSPSKIRALKQLLTNIEPLRNILQEKKVENISLKRQIQRGSKGKKMIIVKEKVKAKALLTINKTTRTIGPQPGPLEFDEETLKSLRGIYDPDEGKK